MKRAILAATMIGALLAPAAVSQQTPAPYFGEIVMTANGQPASPWIARELCRDGANSCATALMNPETDEIAMMGGVLGTDFERTGNGQEIRRAETALAKAIRLEAASGQ